MNQPTPIRSTENARGLVSAFARARRKRYIDDLMDDYVSWREACAAVAVTYETWKGAVPAEREFAFSLYYAALDREEETARTYEAAIAHFPGA